MSPRSLFALAPIALASWLTACAAPDPAAATDTYSAPVRRTGSNIPAGREEAPATRTPSTVEQQRIDETVLPRPARGGGGGG